MPICKYCGNEAGEGEFCRSCGAKNEAAAVTPQRMTEEDYRQLENQQTYTNDQGKQGSYEQPDRYFRPQSASGLLAANIVVLVLAVLTFCNSLGVTGLAIIFSIIGIISASRVKNAKSEIEVHSCRSGATTMLVMGIIALVVGFVVHVVLKIIGSLANGLISLIF